MPTPGFCNAVDWSHAKSKAMDRLEYADRSLIKQAARKLGLTVEDFIVKAVMDAADESN